MFNKLSGENIPKPVTTFLEGGFEPVLIRILEKMQGAWPTPIQMQVLLRACRNAVYELD